MGTNGSSSLVGYNFNPEIENFIKVDRKRNHYFPYVTGTCNTKLTE